MTVQFFSDDFIVSTTQTLAAYGGYIDNTDRNDFEVVAADNAARSTVSQQRFAGPTKAPSTDTQEVRIRGYLGGTELHHRIGAICRWNGLPYSDSNVRAYRVMVRAGTDYIVSRHVGTNVTWLDRGGSVVHSLPASVGATEEFGLALLAYESGGNTELQAYIDTGSGWTELGAAFVDSSVDQITAFGNVGMFVQRSVSRITSLEGRDLGAGILTEDPFDNVTAGNTESLANRTDPVSWAGNTNNASVVGDLDKLRKDSDTNFVASIDVEDLGQGYIGELVGIEFPDNVGGDHVGVVVRSNKGNWGTTITCYELQVRVSDEWYLYRRVDGGFSILDSDNSAPFGLTWESVVGIQLKTAENGAGNVVIDAWVQIDGGAFSQIITGLIDDSTTVGEERILDTGTVGIHGNRSGQLFDRLTALQEAPTVITVNSVTPSVIKDGDTFTLNGTFPSTVTSVTIDGASQTIDSQDGEAVNCTFALGDVEYGTQVITADDGTNTDTVSAVVESVSGIEWDTVERLPWPSGQLSTFSGSTGTVTNGMQVEWTIPTSLSADNYVYFDGVPEVISDTGDHTFDVRVHDGTERGPWATYTISADIPAAPVADAGPNRSMVVGATITIDGSGTVADGGIEEDGINWEIITKPIGGSGSFLGDDTLTPDFTVPDTSGNYELQLSVTDNFGQTDTDTMVVSVTSESPGSDPDPDEPDDPDTGSDAATLDKHDPSIMKVIPVQYANAIRTTKDFSTTSHVISDIPWDDEYATWDSGTSYNVGDRVSYQVVNLVPHIYEALVQTTVGRNPGVFNVDRHGVGHEWSEWATVSAVNAYRAFDQDGDTETRHASSFTYTIDSGTSVDYMAFMGLHADSVDIRVETSGGTVLHDETYIPNARYFADILIVNDFPQVFPLETMFFITVTGSPARATHIIMGRQNLIGISQYGVELGFKDFSRVERDEFGHLSVTPRRVIDTKRINVIIEAGFEHEVNSYMSAFTARRALFVGSDEVGPYIFGIARRFRVLYSNPRQSECEIVVEGA